MKQGKAFLENIKKMASGGLTPKYARVESYEDGLAQLALLPDEDILIDVPGAIMQAGEYFISMPLKKGDLVCVAFTSTDINDCLIVGLVGTEEPPPLLDGNGLMIGKQGGASLIINDDGSININAPGGLTVTGSTTSESW